MRTQGHVHARRGRAPGAVDAVEEVLDLEVGEGAVLVQELQHRRREGAQTQPPRPAAQWGGATAGAPRWGGPCYIPPPLTEEESHAPALSRGQGQ